MKTPHARVCTKGDEQNRATLSIQPKEGINGMMIGM